jgi:signal transduction histidine kinase
MPHTDRNDESRILLFTPTGRDSALIADVLLRSGIQSQICSSVPELIEEIESGCAAVLISEEALNAECTKHIGRVLDAQPTWSDLPLIVLTTGAEQSPRSDYKLKVLSPLGNVSLIERPVRPSTLVSVIQAALRARDRQYQFREQAKALQRSNEDLQRFAKAASHDLQEPLRMIASYTQLLVRRNEGQLDKDSQQFARYILNGVDRMQILIRDLLDFSRHTGCEYPSPTRVDCNAVLGLALQYLRFKIDESAAVISFDPLPAVLGHETRLFQVFQNLISNALKYCERKPQIQISASQEDGFGVISIKDNGIGIAPEHQQRIFGLFQRLHTRDEYPGSGIGLATCKRIVEQYGGRIWVESVPGVGSTFHFSLPIAEDPGVPDERTKDMVGAGKNSP